MNTLLYLSYGSGPHEQEVAFSVWSAARWSQPDAAHRTVIYTDHPDSFRSLPVDVHYVSPQQWTDWAGSRQFNHRRKILALQHALKHWDGPVALLDGDTWWRKPVETLFQRVSPGHALMHIREGGVAEINTPLFQQMRDVLRKAELQDSDGGRFHISPDAMMYNAGVIGIHPADAFLLDEVLGLTDQLCDQSDLHVLEQCAFSYVLAQRTNLQEGDDLVFHYWPPYLHDPFREKLEDLIARANEMPIEKRAEFLFSNRPRPTWKRRCKVVAKRVLQAAGIVRGRCRSNEW